MVTTEAFNLPARRVQSATVERAKRYLRLALFFIGSRLKGRRPGDQEWGAKLLTARAEGTPLSVVRPSDDEDTVAWESDSQAFKIERRLG